MTHFLIPALLQTLSLLPGDADLRGPRAYQKLVVQASQPDGRQKDVTSQAKLVSANPKVARIDGDAVLRPVSDGATTVTATLGSSKATIRVQVRGASAAPAVSF